MPDQTRPSGVDSERPPRPRRPRWGVRTLAFLGLAMVSALTVNTLADLHVTTWAPVAGLGFLVGVLGAAYCSYRGLRAFDWLQR